MLLSGRKKSLQRVYFLIAMHPTDMITDFNLEGRVIGLREYFFINCGSVNSDKKRTFFSQESGPRVPSELILRTQQPKSCDHQYMVKNLTFFFTQIYSFFFI